MAVRRWTSKKCKQLAKKCTLLSRRIAKATAGVRTGGARIRNLEQQMRRLGCVENVEYR